MIKAGLLPGLAVLPCLASACTAIYMLCHICNNILSCVLWPQADVFSFGMMLYQLVQRYLTIMAVSIKGDPEEVVAYAARVAAGYRPPINNKELPPSVVELIQVRAGNDTDTRRCTR
jgi:hypothetical protein